MTPRAKAPGQWQCHDIGNLPNYVMQDAMQEYLMQQHAH